MLKPFNKLADKTLIIAHRGASGYAPENTPAAFEQALRMKADMIELDIQLTSDNHWVVMHDLTLKRTCGLSRKVSLTPLSTLQTLEAGSWFSSLFSGERIMTLDEILSWARNRMNLNIEIKGRLKRGVKNLQTLLSKIAGHYMTKNVLISSFNWKILREIRQLNRTISIGILVNREPQFLYFREAIDLKALSIHLPLKKMKKAVGKKIHDHHIKVFIYTINHLNEVKKCLEMGADGIFTNYPDLPRGKDLI